MGEFASKGVAGAALGTGIGGLALGVLNGAGGLLNLMGGNCGGCGNGYAGIAMVNRYELGLVQELAAKDAKIGLLEADKYTDQKIVGPTPHGVGGLKLSCKCSSGDSGKSHPARGGWIEM